MKKTYFSKGFLALIPVWILTQHTAEALRFFGATVILYVLTMLFANLVGRLKNKLAFEIIMVAWLLVTVSLGHFFFDWDPRMLVSLLFLLPISFAKKEKTDCALFDFKQKSLSAITSQASIFLSVFAFFLLIQAVFNQGYFLWLNHTGGLFVFASLGAWLYQWIQKLKSQKEES